MAAENEKGSRSAVSNRAKWRCGLYSSNSTNVPHGARNEKKLPRPKSKFVSAVIRKSIDRSMPTKEQ